MKPNRILMNAHGTSPGSGQTPSPAPAPNPSPAPASGGAPAAAPAPTPQAQGASPPLSADAIKAIADAVGTAVKDGVFADLRRAGVLKGKTPTPAPAAGSEPGEPATPAAPTFDPMRMRELDRALSRAGLAERLDGDAYKRIERAFAEEAPSSAEQWVTAYFRGMGVTPAQPAQPQQPQPQTPIQQQPSNQPPVSDRGAPPASQVQLEEPDLIKASDADRKALISSKGPKWYMETLQKQMKGRPVKLR